LRLRLFLALLLATGLALAVFSPAVMTGQLAALAAPQGDQAQTLAGAYYFYRDAWRWPLFETMVPGTAEPSNIAFTDSIPWLSLGGKALFQLTGRAINPTAPWLWVCMLGQAVAITLLLEELGLRRLPETVAAVVLAAVMPAFLFRYWMWHLPLCGHFLIVLALALTVRAQRVALDARSALPWAALLVVGLWTHPYFVAMTGPFFVVSAGAAAWRSTGPARSSAIVGAVIVCLALALALVVGGYVQGGHPVSGEYGIYSMNALAPFGAMGKSGLFPGSGHFARATDGQMEGFNYLGWGFLFSIGAASVACFGARGAPLRRRLRAYWPVMGLLVAFTLFALSNNVYVGDRQVASFRLPHLADRLAGVFRSSGRFFWPVAYALLAFSVLGIARGYRASVAAGLFAIAVALQWADTQVLRTVIITEKPADPIAADPTVASLVASHRAISIHPTVRCTDDKHMLPAAFALQFLAAREGMSINSLSAARRGDDCTGEERRLLETGLTPGTLLALGPPYDAAFVAARGWQRKCHQVGSLYLCSTNIGGAEPHS
jgi:hypothetical protein